MKIALVHDWFDQVYGGSERTALSIAKMFPDCDVFTMMFNDDIFGGTIDPKRLRTSFLDRWPNFITKRHHYLLPFIPNAIESYDFSGYDLVISSSPAFSKNVITPPETIHVTYCHSPMRFAWDYWPQYMYDNNFGPIKRMIARGQVNRIRQWDLHGVSRVDHWLTNSKTSANRIKKYYRVTAQVLHPPANLTGAKPSRKKGNYYVTLATLTPYKKLDIAIEAFNVNGQKLLIIGDGPDRERLQNLAKGNIKFAGFVKDEKKWKLLAGAKGLIFPQEEDFGLAPIDAMACATPVIAYGKGGALETVIDKKTGVFFKTQSVEALNQAITKAESIHFETQNLVNQAKKFSEPIFQRRLHEYLKKVMKHHADQA